MKYTMNFGRLAARTPRIKPSGVTFRIAILGDFSGRANAGRLEIGPALAARKPLPVDVDNIETVVRQMDLQLHLPIAADGGTIEIRIESIDDFHPDQLYSNLPLFSELSGLRRRLKNTSTFADADREMQSWSGIAVPSGPASRRGTPRGTAIPQGKLSDFARLIGQTTATTARETPVDKMIAQIVAPHLVPAEHPDQRATITAVDEAISTAMRRIIHHPDFQALESLWRSVELLIRELETGPHLQIILYDITAEEIAADLSSSDALDQTGLYRLLEEQPALDQRSGPLSVLVGNYVFDLTPPHAELLGRIGKVAAAAQAPFIAAISTDCLIKQDPEDVHPLIAASWDTLRETPQANYLGLTVPRFMLRWPYGAKTEPIDSFEFEEFTPQAGLKSMLWANGAILAGLLLGRTFSEQGIPGMRLGTVMSIGDVPFYYYTDDEGDQIALPSTERLVPESIAAHIMSQNFMPVLCIRGRPEIRLGSFQSLAGNDLAGPWSPLAVEPDEKLEVSAAADVPRTEPLTVDLDALLAGLATEKSVSPEDNPDIDPDLAALLADL